MSFTIQKYQAKDKASILHVWEESVLVTHTFLIKSDFEKIKHFLLNFDFELLEVFTLKLDEEVIGFVATNDFKIEMLFLSPNYIGLGLGRKLIQFAIQELKANKVDVNEQNVKAVEFYEKIGFTTYERTNKDDQGKGYPLLRMKLNSVK